jgi:phage gp46-like protein
MCCQETETLDLPAEVIETLAGYRRLLADRGWDWGDAHSVGHRLGYSSRHRTTRRRGRDYPICILM